MIIFNAYLPSVKWNVYISEFHSFHEAERMLDNAECPEGIKEELLSVLKKKDSAFTYTNPKVRMSVIVIGDLTSKLEFVDSLFHELIHLVNHISEELNISTNDEELCTEIGHLSELIIRLKLCSSPRCYLNSLQEYESEYL